jgi:uncharacterized damage-inducible protein DinB
MTISEALLPEFDHEMANTRKTLERVPDDKLGWRPHQKSMTMGGLATHIANLLTWTGRSINESSFDMNPAGGPPPRMEEAGSREEILAMFDQNVANARAAIVGATDDHLLSPWSLLSSGNVILTMPRVAVLRSFIMNHSIHHRAQLGVYLRMNDVPVPSIYGPSADENPFY